MPCRGLTGQGGDSEPSSGEVGRDLLVCGGQPIDGKTGDNRGQDEKSAVDNDPGARMEEPTR